jgi:glycosyltransferase involved in cell wall biosynthesis
MSKEKHNSRILWVSNAPWAGTGYGQQTAQVIPRLKKDNYEIAVAANYGLEANNTFWNSKSGPIQIYARGHDQYSNDVIPAHMYDWSVKDPEAKNLLITLFDVWVFKGDKWSDWNVASWVPIDHLPAPVEVLQWCKKPNVSPIAMSKFGQQMLENAGIESYYVPHAVESVYKPTHYLPELKMTPREFMGLPEDAFVVGMNAANKGVYPCRKAFGENLLAFSMFAQGKENVYLYLHTDASGSLGGIRLKDLIMSVGIPEDKVVFVDPYLLRTGLSIETMAGIYTAMDVLLATSYGEGFGVPTIEAQACGTPVIVSDFAASSELVGDGWKIGGQPLWDAPQKAFFHVPNVSEIVNALQESYERERVRSEKAIEFAKQYEANFVYETYWKPTLRAIFDKKPPATSPTTKKD